MKLEDGSDSQWMFGNRPSTTSTRSRTRKTLNNQSGEHVGVSSPISSSPSLPFVPPLRFYAARFKWSVKGIQLIQVHLLLFPIPPFVLVRFSSCPLQL